MSRIARFGVDHHDDTDDDEVAAGVVRIAHPTSFTAPTSLRTSTTAAVVAETPDKDAPRVAPHEWSPLRPLPTSTAAAVSVGDVHHDEQYSTPEATTEEDEDTGSEAVEPTTPTSETVMMEARDFAHAPSTTEKPTTANNNETGEKLEKPRLPPLTSVTGMSNNPVITSTAPTPPTSSQGVRSSPPRTNTKPLPAEHSPTTPKNTSTSPSANNAPPTPTAAPESPSIRRSTGKRISSFFRRSNSHAASSWQFEMPPNQEQQQNQTQTSTTQASKAVPAAHRSHANPPSRGEPSEKTNGILTPPRRLSGLSWSARNSPRGSNANTPPSPSSPVHTIVSNPDWMTPASQADEVPPKTVRSSTGLSLHDRMSRIKFSNGSSNNHSSRFPEGGQATSATKHGRRPSHKRSNSMTGMPHVTPDNSISMHAATGAGLKARRMSTSLPDDFRVDAVELNLEFTSTSVVPGRRGKTVGSGATAMVKLMARKGGSPDEIYAVKEFRKRSKNEDEEEYEKKVKSEYTIAKSLHHPNLVETVRLCTHHGRWNHVMEYCPQGELFSLVQKGYMQESDRLCLFKQLLRGVAYLHSHGIAHRDIKLENLLLTNEGHLKITDFGVSEVFCGEHPGLRSSGGECGKNMAECRRCAPGICGSLPYIAPEVLEKKGDYDPRPLDVWSCALVYLTMRFRGSPWHAAERGQPQYDKFLRGWDRFLTTYPEGLVTDESGAPRCGPVFAALDSTALRKLVLRMMHPNPEKRIGISEAANDRWVKKIECCVQDAFEGEASASSPTDPAAQGIDAAGRKSCRIKPGGIQKLHNHLPPTKRVMSFDIKEI